MLTLSAQYKFTLDDVLQEWSEEEKSKFKYEDDKGRYRLIGRFLKDSPIINSKSTINIFKRLTN